MSLSLVPTALFSCWTPPRRLNGREQQDRQERRNEGNRLISLDLGKFHGWKERPHFHPFLAPSLMSVLFLTWLTFWDILLRFYYSLPGHMLLSLSGMAFLNRHLPCPGYSRVAGKAKVRQGRCLLSPLRGGSGLVGFALVEKKERRCWCILAGGRKALIASEVHREWDDDVFARRCGRGDTLT